ncbi:hypothetical protein HHI36_009147 [Cryptolaemus montrouzieri]|uniref:Ribosomal protein L20 n=1 Tax=Cryptolaemus montrouzieri TaxID=559131 RepID=A0ABD2MUN4_9CUCU
MTIGIRISSRRKLFLHHLKTRGEISTKYFNQFSRRLKKVVRKAKKMANECFIFKAKNESRATWNLIKKYTTANSKYKITVLEGLSNQIYHKKSLDIANDFFVNHTPFDCVNVLSRECRFSTACVLNSMALHSVDAMEW